MIKLLIADDEPLVLAGMKSMLPWNRLGLEICGTAQNGQQALELIRQYRPDARDVRAGAGAALPRGVWRSAAVYHADQL